MAHADVFQKNEKKNKTTTVYRLDVNGRRTLRSVLAISFRRPIAWKDFHITNWARKKIIFHFVLYWLGWEDQKQLCKTLSYFLVAKHNSPYAWLRQTSKFHQQASFVNKIFCICTFCAWVFFSTLLPWEFISVKLRLFLISKRGLVVKFACVT